MNTKQALLLLFLFTIAITASRAQTRTEPVSDLVINFWDTNESVKRNSIETLDWLNPSGAEFRRPPLFVGSTQMPVFDGDSPAFATGWDAQFPSSVGGTISAMTVSGDDLYVGGRFTSIGGVAVKNIAKWNGTTWVDLSANLVALYGSTFTISTIAISGTDIYIGGFFRSGSPNIDRALFVKWDGSQWSRSGFGAVGSVFADETSHVSGIVISGSDVYIRGSFDYVGPTILRTFSSAKWNGSEWSGSGPTGVHSAAYVASGGEIYASDARNVAPDGTPLNTCNIGRLVGVTWSCVGGDVNGLVHAIAVNGNDIYVGGEFTTAGGISANRIAKWNGSSWTAFGTGLDQTVRAIALSGTDVYVAGTFTTAGGISANRIAKWNGTAWSALGTGLNNQGTLLAAKGSSIFVGGTFTQAGPLSANRLAKWDGGGCFGEEEFATQQMLPYGGFLGEGFLDEFGNENASLGFLTWKDGVPMPCTPNPYPLLQFVAGSEFFSLNLPLPAPTIPKPNRWLYGGKYLPNFTASTRTVTINYFDGINSPSTINMIQPPACVYAVPFDDNLYFPAEGLSIQGAMEISPLCQPLPPVTSTAAWIDARQESGRVIIVSIPPLPAGVNYRAGALRIGDKTFPVIQDRNLENVLRKPWSPINYFRQKLQPVCWPSCPPVPGRGTAIGVRG